MSNADANAPFDPKRDNEAVYEEFIAPLVEALRDACRAKGIPMIAVAQIGELRLAACYFIPSGAHGFFVPMCEMLELEPAPETEPN